MKNQPLNKQKVPGTGANIGLVTNNCVKTFLDASSKSAEVMTIRLGQASHGVQVTVTAAEVSNEYAKKLANSEHFDAMLQEAEDRRKVGVACEKARRFFVEHILTHNPFPPKNKLEKPQAKKRQRRKPSDVATSSSVSTESSNSQPSTLRSPKSSLTSVHASDSFIIPPTKPKKTKSRTSRIRASDTRLSLTSSSTTTSRGSVRSKVSSSTSSSRSSCTSSRRLEPKDSRIFNSSTSSTDTPSTSPPSASPAVSPTLLSIHQNLLFRR
ncbi:unnamed protein product [Caenorhabditis auriculariae]|uniref:Uncharacterized protein n=1 Tax=Caenorhabditis auriculariae TaxID=2777116 RepID=A0A8S1H697_9PELO|nr:unnamed protein product [Caenorhabditis auriculariae]